MGNHKIDVSKKIETGILLRKMRSISRLTQVELADMLRDKYQLEYSVSQISRLEKGETAQSFDYVIHCCDICGVHPISFMIGLMHDDKKWTSASLAANAGAFFYDMIFENFQKYGDQLMLLDDEDQEMIKALLASYLTVRFIHKHRVQKPEPYLSRVR